MSLFDWQKSDVAATAAFFSIVFCVRGSSTWAGEKRRRATRAPSSARRARAARPKIEPKRLVKCRRPSIPGHSPPHLADDRRRLLELLADHGHLLDVRRPRLLRVETLRALHELPLDLAELEQRRDDLRVAARSRRGEVSGRLHGSSQIPEKKKKRRGPTWLSLCIISVSMAWSAKIMHESYSAMGRASSDRRMAVLPSKWTMRRLPQNRESPPSTGCPRARCRWTRTGSPCPSPPSACPGPPCRSRRATCPGARSSRRRRR